MPDIFDLINTLAFGQRQQGDGPRGLTTPSPLAALMGPGAMVANTLAPAVGDRLAQFAAVPGPPRDLNEMVQRLGQVLGGAGQLGQASGVLAFNPILQREAQIAGSPGFANNPVPGASGLAANFLAVPSLLPGGQQVASALGVPDPTVGYGDVLGPAYAAAQQQGGGLPGLGAALERLAEIQHQTPEVIPGQKFAAENVLNLINYLPVAAKMPGVVGEVGRAGTDVLNLPFTAAKRALGATPVLGQLSDFSQVVRESRFREDLLRNLGAALDAAGLKTPAIVGKTAQDPRMQAAVTLRAATAEAPEDAALLAQNVAQATEASAAARAAVEATLPAPVAGGAPASAAVGAAGEAAAGALPPLNWFNNRAQAAYRLAQEASEAALGHRPPPATDIPLTTLRKALDPEDQADAWLGAVLENIRTEGVRSGRVVEPADAATRRTSYQRGLGGLVGGQTSERVGAPLYEPDTIGQVSFAAKRLQDRGALPPGEPVRLATALRWAEDQYGPVFPAPPPGEQTYWAAIQAHMDRAAGAPPPVAPPGGAEGVADLTASGVGSPPGTAPSSPPGAAAEASLLSTPPAAPGAPTAAVDDAALLAREAPAVPPEAFPAGVTAQDPAVLQELTDARKALGIAQAESTDMGEILAARQRVRDAEAAATQVHAEALPSRDQVLTGELANQIAVARSVFDELVPAGRQGDATAFGQQVGTALDKLVPDLERAQALRAEAGLAEGATLKDVAQTLKAQGSELAGEAAQIASDWRSDILTGDLNHILTQKTMGEYVKARGLDEHAFGGPTLFRNVMDGLSGAWRAQALVSVAFHVKNVADSVIKSYVDSGKPGFLADARPWQPAELANLIKTAWAESGPHDPNRVLSPQLRVWGAIHDLDVYETMFAAKNPTLDAALATLTPAQRTSVMSSLSPVERALMQVDPRAAVPSAIAEALGPLEPGGWLGKVPGVDRVLALNLRLTMGIEQSARGAKFIDAYKAGIDQGLPKLEAYQQGVAEANRLFFDYQGDLTNLDRLARNVFAFHIFSTRNINYWAPVLASNPILLKALAGYEEWSNAQAEEGGYAANRRFAESVKFPVVGGVGGALAQALFGRQGQIFWNPIAYLSIAEQTLSTPQEYRDEPLPGKLLSKARSVGLGLAPWIDMPLSMLGTYGARGPQSITSLDPLINSAAQTVLGRPTELPWQTIQRIRPAGQATAAAPDIAVRQRLAEMSLEERPDFVQVSPGQPIHPDFVRAMAEGPSNPLYQEAARDLGKERLLGTLAGKVVGGGPAFQSEMAGRMAAAEGNAPRDATRGQRQAYQAQRVASLGPDAVPLITARREITMKNLNEPGSQPAGEPPESMTGYIARIWPTASPARQWALLQTQDPAMQEAIAQYLGRRVHLRVPGRS